MHSLVAALEGSVYMHTVKNVCNDGSLWLILCHDVLHSHIRIQQMEKVDRDIVAKELKTVRILVSRSCPWTQNRMPLMHLHRQTFDISITSLSNLNGHNYWNEPEWLKHTASSIGTMHLLQLRQCKAVNTTANLEFTLLLSGLWKSLPVPDASARASAVTSHIH